MKSLWNILSAFVMVNLLAVAALLVWLATSGRLSQQRVDQVIDTFRPTIAQAQAAAEQAQRSQDEKLQAEQDLVRLERVSKGPTTFADRLRDQQEGQEIAAQKLAWMRSTIASLTHRLENDKTQVKKLKAELDAAQAAFDNAVQARAARQNNQDFQIAVRMYEQLEPDQAKSMFKELLKQGNEGQVIDYLASMQLRKAAAVLREFQDEEELIEATNLIQRLRERGVDPVTKVLQSEPQGST